MVWVISQVHWCPFKLNIRQQPISQKCSPIVKLVRSEQFWFKMGLNLYSVCLALLLQDMVLLYSVLLITGALSVLSMIDDMQVDMRRISLASSSRRPTVSTWGWTACRSEWTCWQWRSHNWTPPWRKVGNKHCCCQISVVRVTTSRHPHWCFWMIPSIHPTLFTMILDHTTAQIQSRACPKAPSKVWL